MLLMSLLACFSSSKQIYEKAVLDCALKSGIPQEAIDLDGGRVWGPCTAFQQDDGLAEQFYQCGTAAIQSSPCGNMDDLGQAGSQVVSCCTQAGEAHMQALMKKRKEDWAAKGH